ncbi:hypothetical protein NEMBOFW57_004937 [Staphylotrichum longicolle]|uniref:Indoleamine 2,3-dioxygenase n=1 Tax=Staphylotrichum longicolle TaxID=669026 RepID=A0AAD4EW01_9PEZI|nr:hypothetical protein NEMBOFW57_004937 [Staphylotrichum longicolle]
MGSLGQTLPPFTVLDDTRPDDMSLPAFMVSTTRGFLPRMDPIVTLPPEFDALESILQRMPVKTLSGEPGLLAHGKLGDTVTAELPDLTDAVDKYKDNLPLMNALYRDYSFLASAYLLEPCHERFVKGEGYGLGRDVLPANIARPIAKTAALCDFQPFMEYAGSYALFNYRLVDPSLGLEYSNLRLIRAFEHGLDPTSSEAGFVLVHIAMVKHSGQLVAGAVACLKALDAHNNNNNNNNSNSTANDASTPRQALNAALAQVLAALRQINKTMETMWTRSSPTHYTSFRTFIFGITSQSMFPQGVTYKGVPELGDKPVSFRGESGANDSMVPLVDNLCGVPMPQTPLTEILKDFRRYRPGEHRGFLEWVRRGSEEGGLKGEYILKRTSHPTATGGSPIVTWLPNQLAAVMDEMARLYESVGGEGLGEEVEGIMDLVGRQREMLRKEVRKFCEERGVKGDIPFATLAVCPAPPTPATQLAVPHAYPLGQHPATGPASAPHMNHPLAQLPVVSAGAPLTGTTTVTPFPFTTVVMACCGGHDVVAQSRPYDDGVAEGSGEGCWEEVGRKGAPAPPPDDDEEEGDGEEFEARLVWVTVEVTAGGEVEGVMVMTTVTRMVDGVGREMMLVEVVVRVAWLPAAQSEMPPPQVAPDGQHPTGPSPVSGTCMHVSPVPQQLLGYPIAEQLLVPLGQDHWRFSRRARAEAARRSRSHAGGGGVRSSSSNSGPERRANGGRRGSSAEALAHMRRASSVSWALRAASAGCGFRGAGAKAGVSAKAPYSWWNFAPWSGGILRIAVGRRC